MHLKRTLLPSALNSITLFILLSQTTTELNSKSIDQLDDPLIQKTLDALKKSASFFERNVEKVNLDSIFGLRAAEGKLLFLKFFLPV